MELLVEVDDSSADESVITLTGSLDLASRGQLIEAAGAAIDAGRGLVLDLAELTFLDSTGIGALVEAAGMAADAEQRFRLRNPSARVARVLELTGMSEQWQIETTG
ncbi:MAG TPA: STAS domain-containing protein [Jatrophihabitans sp.]|nr:STAS domain-containing protein [Jatrophihabitans sp.]